MLFSTRPLGPCYATPNNQWNKLEPDSNLASHNGQVFFRVANILNKLAKPLLFKEKGKYKEKQRAMLKIWPICSGDLATLILVTQWHGNWIRTID